MFPRVTLLYRLLAVCILVSIIMILLQTADDRVHSKRLPLEVIREQDSYIDIKTAGQPSKPRIASNSSSPNIRMFSGKENLQTTRIPPVNPHNFKYIINPRDTCKSKNLKYIIYVHSAPKNHKKRQMVRQTWGARSVLQKYSMRIVFIMGVVEDISTMERVKYESNSYGDIVVENFLDSYRNLTFKAIAGLKWVSKHCDNATYVIKSDDDILIDMHALMQQMNSTEIKNYGTKNLIMCNQWVRMKVIRDKKSKWYISEKEFPDEYFPPYCSGSVFIMSTDAVQRMYQASLDTTFFWVDDFYLTGLLVKKIGIGHKRLNENYMLNARVAMDKLKEDKKHELRFFHVHKLTQIYRMWSILKERMNSTCKDFLTRSSEGNVTTLT
ncbi:beta-1,3-galactosyltransferase 1-like [Mercenaria mercenaria]|uniref:beta-1,3-galactosyltransferase 1-like n=1 Tax=Mercenaria mercenaria TaxID=6596 RepID=UPI00234E8238|nr:beta-1,3-galactosyltransferase 1-like [Mercenaria mercenaria]XP_053378020.1 beta-1,3-galactosyltransferase 1-like [Mercenaria mercenaria]